MAHTNLGHEFLKTFAIDRGSAGMPQIAIDDDNALGRPAKRDGSLPQRVLTLGALRVFQYLPWRGLADVKIGVALQSAQRSPFAGQQS